jgi:diaminopimelate decarboxylase
VPADANALSAGLWPASARRNSAGELLIGGLTATDLAAEFGTPLYVIDETDARTRAVELRATFEREFARVGTTVGIYYAGKAFLSIEIARWMADAGLNIDICSGGELAVALAAGVDPGRLGFHGNNKSLAEIDEATRIGIGSIVVDSRIEIDRIAAAAARHGRVQAVRLRVNSGVHAHTHEFLATAHEDQKFGITLEDAPTLVAAIRAEPALRFLGLHCHIGSQIFGAESASRLLAVHATLLETGPVPELNLGGGFGIAYVDSDTPSSFDELATRLADIVAAGCGERGIPLPRVAFEPGRVIIGPAGLTLYSVGTTKAVAVAGPDSSNTRLYVSVDGGMSDNVRPALYGADYAVRLANRMSTADAALVRIAGKHCESGDIVVNADYLPGDVTPGDLVAVPATGAYCWSLSNNYNYQGRAPVIAVKNASARVLVRGETIADLLARDAGSLGATPSTASTNTTGTTR